MAPAYLDFAEFKALWSYADKTHVTSVIFALM